MQFKLVSVPIAALALCSLGWSQTFTSDSVRPVFTSEKSMPALPFLANYATYDLDVKNLKSYLAGLPVQRYPGDRQNAGQIEIPMPDHTTQRFRIVEAPIMTPALAEQIPVKTYAGYGVDDRTATIRLDTGPNGFHGYVYSANGDVVIEPAVNGQADQIVSYFKRDNLQPRNWSCGTPTVEDPSFQSRIRINPVSSTLKTYRLAMNADYEYYVYCINHGLTPSAAVVSSVNRVVGVYEKYFSISMTLVYNKIWDTSSDPYTNNNGGSMLGQNQSSTDSLCGNANYDIGHVFSTGGGGIAGLRVVGVTGQKARGVTGSPAPVGDGYDIDYVAHEMGHQYGGNHTFNGTTGSCAGNRVSSAAYEPGSGSTVMAYAGICGVEDLQPHSDAYFHTKSFDEIMAWRNNSGSGGSATTLTNNNPTVSAGPNYTIPLNTPYRLTASGSDPDGNALTFCWEEFDLGTAGPNINMATSPLVRSKNPTTSPTRFIPAIGTVLAGTTDKWELLPTVGRTMKWRVTARDNVSGGGGSAYSQTSITASGNAFTVNTPSGTWTGNTTQTVTWNPGGATGNVNILLSINGGSSYATGGATLLLANTANDGSENITVPNTPTSTARIIVEGADNIYYNVSQNFTITAGSNNQFVTPSNLTVFRGTVDGGDLNSLQSSDDNRLLVRTGMVLNSSEAPIQVIVTATSPFSTSSDLKFKVESNGSTGNLLQSIELYDWTSGQYVSFNASTLPLSDGTIEITASNPQRFLQSGTNLMRSRVTVKPNGPILSFPYQGRFDLMGWTVTN